VQILNSFSKCSFTIIIHLVQASCFTILALREDDTLVSDLVYFVGSAKFNILKVADIAVYTS